MYRRTADNAYIQPLPNGEILSFMSDSVQTTDSAMAPNTKFAWGRAFANPMCVLLQAQHLSAAHEQIASRSLTSCAQPSVRSPSSFCNLDCTSRTSSRQPSSTKLQRTEAFPLTLHLSVSSKRQGRSLLWAQTCTHSPSSETQASVASLMQRLGTRTLTTSSGVTKISRRT